MSDWKAEITNDSENDYNLIIELLHQDEYIGRIKKKDSEFVIQFYKSTSEVTIPADWLLDILNKAKSDLV